MVIGSYSVSVDSKGRIFVPAKWRNDYGDTLIAVRGFTDKPDERFITVMPVEHFERLSNDLDSLHPTDLRYNDAARNIFQYAFSCDIDSKGRILIDKSLLDYAGIASGASLTATKNKCFEVWEPERLTAKNCAYTQLDSSRDLQRRADELESAGK